MSHCHLLFQLSYPRMWYRAFLGSSTCFVSAEHVHRSAARASRDLDEPEPKPKRSGRACERNRIRMQALSRRSAKIATECPAGADRANENERRLANPAHEIARAAAGPRSQEQHVARASKHLKKFLLRRGRANCVRCKRKIHLTVNANEPSTAELKTTS